MSDSYQPIYDAVRSRIGSCDIERAAREAFDASFAIERIRIAFEEAAQSMDTPAVLYRPRISIDGNKWCALYGDNVQDGVAGFGDSPHEAMHAFNIAWFQRLEPQP